MPVGHMLDSLGGSIKTLSFDLREKKKPFLPSQGYREESRDLTTLSKKPSVYHLS